MNDISSTKHQTPSLSPEIKITPQQTSNQWLYELTNNTLFLTTLETTAGRLKLTMQEQHTSTPYLKTYMCLISMNELIEQNTFFTVIDDVDVVEKVFTLIITNPSKISIGVYEDKQQHHIISQSYIQFQLQLPTNKQPLLTLRLNCIMEESNMVKDNEVIIKDAYERLEQKYFDLAVQIKEMFNRNGIEWGEEIFPENIMIRCKDKWLNEHVEEEFPKFNGECVFHDIKDLVNKIEVSDDDDDVEDNVIEENDINNNNNNTANISDNDDNNIPTINVGENTTLTSN